MLCIRLQRIGRKKEPIYNIVVVDKKKTRNRSFIAKLGFYIPKKKHFAINWSLTKYWLAQGALPTNKLLLNFTPYFSLQKNKN